MDKKERYQQFLEAKIIQTPASGFKSNLDINPILFRHQPEIVTWALEGGRRAIFAQFGLGKTIMQLEIANHVVFETYRPFLIGLPLGVKQEFYDDADRLGYKVKYVKDMLDIYADMETEEPAMIYLSNYERIREGKFDPSIFGGVSFDEGDAIRNLDTETTDYIMNKFNVVPYRFIATATPSPNDYTEILNYAQFLGIMDRSQALTRFFQRNSTTAGDLTIYPHKEKEFWFWVRSWALIINRPSDLGHSDEGYDLDPLTVHYHRVNVKDRGDIIDKRDGQMKMIADTTKSLVDVAREKRDSMEDRIEKAMQIIAENPNDNFILWHHREKEREMIEKALPGVKSVYGSQNTDDREDNMIGFKQGDFQYLSTKPEIAGSGCNFQAHCYKAIFVGIDYRFKDFIQAIHRIHRFGQKNKVEIHIIFSDAEDHVLKTLEGKWQAHIEMVEKMSEMIRQYGLSSSVLASELRRTIGVNRQETIGKNYHAIHNDSVLEGMSMKESSIGMIMTSIPFSDQYEYCESYHDMGHNDGNGEFFEQLGFLTEEMYRVLQPGRIACIHVKDRIQFSYQNGQGFTSIIDFMGETVRHFQQHGFWLIGRHVITTDVVMENNQTYRLGWSEQCKDGSKMGCGSPEYLLVFRKPPTDNSNAYADIPVFKTKQEYTRARWQLDAHAYWKSSGDRLLNPEELRKMNLSDVYKAWQAHDTSRIYNHEEHVKLCENLEDLGKLPSTFMAVPPRSTTDDVWDDINRMGTLNTSQALRKKEKHVCPLQFDIIDRAITRYSNEGDSVWDPFGGIMSVPFRCITLGRYGIGSELNPMYWKDGVEYCKAAEYKESVPTLFDTLNQ